MVRMAVHDITHRVQRALVGPGGRLLAHAATLQYLLDQIPTGLVIATAPDGQIVVFNDEAERILGHPLIQVENQGEYCRYRSFHLDGRPFLASEHALARALAGDACQAEIMSYQRGDGAMIQISVNAAPLFDDAGEIMGAVTTFIDVSELRAEEERARRVLERLVEERTRDLVARNAELDRVNAELRTLSESLDAAVQRRTAELARQAQHDHLTGLPNRILLEERLQRAVATAARYGRTLAVLFLDLDGFKFVNDRFGHNAGDDVLREVARRLAAGLRSSDTLARLSGDEFVILIPEMRQVDDAREVAQSLLTRVESPFVVQGRRVVLTASVGISVFPQDATDAATLQQHADTAMYQAKDAGKNQVRFYRNMDEPPLFDMVRTKPGPAQPTDPLRR
jgi:diguanylate cyclase (GGDEF)-like protein/PAS domain S-box-containing protein